MAGEMQIARSHFLGCRSGAEAIEHLVQNASGLNEFALAAPSCSQAYEEGPRFL